MRATVYVESGFDRTDCEPGTLWAVREQLSNGLASYYQLESLNRLLFVDAVVPYHLAPEARYLCRGVYKLTAICGTMHGTRWELEKQ
jgi:hypothetical protein